MTTGHLVTVLVLGLAAYRITRFLVVDSLLEPGRTRVHVNLEKRKGILWQKLYELISCTWCTGFWVSTVVYIVYTWNIFSQWNRYDWLSLFAVTGVQGLLHAIEPGEE